VPETLPYARTARDAAAPWVARLTGALLAAAVATCAALAVTAVAPRAAPVWHFLIAASFLAVALRLALAGERDATVFEVGLIYAAAVWLYVCFPLAGYLVNGLEYGPLNDARLFLAAPGPEEVARIGWMYVAHLAAFVAAYAWFRAPRSSAAPRAMGRVEGLLLLLVVVGAEAWAALVGWQYRWDFVSNLDRYVAFSRLPRMLAQVTGHLDGIRLTAEIALLVFLFQRWARYKVLVIAWLAATAVRTVVARQSRTELVLLCFASAILYDALVKRMKPRRLVAFASVGLVAFLVLGVRRMGSEEVAALSSGRRLFVANEFEVLFANAFDLDSRVRAGTLEALPRGMRANDVFALVPQQLVPWQKIPAADWYVRTMYPEAAEQGVGLAFGTVPEAIVGWGWGELLARGAALGLVLAVLDRLIQKRRAASFWWFTFGVWLSVQIFYSVRTTTFFFLATAWYRFLPVVLAVSAGSWLVRTALGRSPARRA
jgi:hypothetical protein